MGPTGPSSSELSERVNVAGGGRLLGPVTRETDRAGPAVTGCMALGAGAYGTLEVRKGRAYVFWWNGTVVWSGSRWSGVLRNNGGSWETKGSAGPARPWVGPSPGVTA